MGDAQRRRICVPRFLGQKRIQFSKSVAPVPGPGQLLIQVKGNAVCASDLGLFAHGASHTPGHETAGIVAGVGLDAQVAVGTPGVIYLMDFCGECRSCR
ncbi:MAG: alcohol dehydrogenase catalytic domain-containing protein, partial [Armatimonadetes bacterium]|nr:alcohol dehydrogenase catalytic domain-containing protein [Armatimonadota bacterium]